MNTSANTTQAHDATTSTARATGTGFLRRSMAGAVLAAAITATGVGLAATSHADAGEPNFGTPPTANCKTEPWGFLGSQRRTLCDGPISADGSWTRQRTIWAPPHFTSSFCTSSPGSYSGRNSYSGTNCSGGYYVDQRLISSDTYPVQPDTVLPDEPGHLG